MLGTRELCRKKRYCKELWSPHGTTVLYETSSVSFVYLFSPSLCLFLPTQICPCFLLLLFALLVTLVCFWKSMADEYESVPLRQVYLVSPRLLITVAYDDVKVTVTQSDVTSLFYFRNDGRQLSFTLV